MTGIRYRKADGTWAETGLVVKGPAGDKGPVGPPGASLPGPDGAAGRRGAKVRIFNYSATTDGNGRMTIPNGIDEELRNIIIVMQCGDVTAATAAGARAFCPSVVSFDSNTVVQWYRATDGGPVANQAINVKVIGASQW